MVFYAANMWYGAVTLLSAQKVFMLSYDSTLYCTWYDGNDSM